MWEMWQLAVGQTGGGFSGMLWIIPVAVVVLVLLVNAIRIVKEYERGVVLRFGRYHKVKDPGFRVILPWIDRMTKVPLRVVTMDVPNQEVITRDNVSVKVNAVIYLKVIDPKKAYIEVEEYLKATQQIAQTTLRSVLGEADLDEILSEREKTNSQLKLIVDRLTEPWGVQVTAVEIKDVELTETLIRALARVAEAEREREAKVIHATGELEASEKLAEAAGVLSTQPAALQLRYLQTLVEIAADNNSTVIFPLPMDIIKPFMEMIDKVKSS